MKICIILEKAGGDIPSKREVTLMKFTPLILWSHLIKEESKNRRTLSLKDAMDSIYLWTLSYYPNYFIDFPELQR